LGLKILLAGNWRAAIHEKALCNGLIENGCTVTPFKWSFYFNGEGSFIGRIIRRIEYKYLFGRSVRRVNFDLIDALNEEYDLLFLYRPNLISWKTIKEIKKKYPRLIVAAYNNDDPFSDRYSWYVWRVFNKAIPCYDLMYSYRPANVQQYYQFGAQAVEMLPPWFDPSLSYPVELEPREKKKYSSDIVFVGHYENDGRIDLIKRLVSEGIQVALYGPDWNDVIKGDPVLGGLYPVSYLHGEEYNKALSGAAMALVIYSRLNNDVYTRRCFEIPAIKTLMVAKRTQAMLDLYREDQEAVYFSSIDELVAKVREYNGDAKKRGRVAANGYRRAYDSGYDVVSRAKRVMNDAIWLTQSDSSAQ